MCNYSCGVTAPGTDPPVLYNTRTIYYSLMAQERHYKRLLGRSHRRIGNAHPKGHY